MTKLQLALDKGLLQLLPLQLVSAVGAVANDGVWIEPHIVRRIYDPGTGITEKWTEPAEKKAISPATAQLMRRLIS